MPAFLVVATVFGRHGCFESEEVGVVDFLYRMKGSGGT